MAWQKLSQRVAGQKPDGPYEGIPDHLYHGVIDWFNRVVGYTTGGRLNHELLRLLATRLQVRMRRQDVDGFGIYASLTQKAQSDSEFCLDLLDCTLATVGVPNNLSEWLRDLLSEGGSVWTVSDDDDSLIRVVVESAQATLGLAVAQADDAAGELRTAWANAFGRNGDPSDAWDHAIKAVEDILIPVVLPTKPKATLGQVLQELENKKTAGLWEMILPGADKSHDVAPLVALLRLMWPNHDRHGGIMAKRVPSESEARAVVTLAATIVQWHREGWVVRMR